MYHVAYYKTNQIEVLAARNVQISSSDIVCLHILSALRASNKPRSMAILISEISDQIQEQTGARMNSTLKKLTTYSVGPLGDTKNPSAFSIVKATFPAYNCNPKPSYTPDYPATSSV